MPIFAGEHGKEKPKRNASSGRFIARAHTAGITVHYGWLMMHEGRNATYGPSRMTTVDSPPPSSLKCGTQRPISLRTPRQERTSEPQLRSELEGEHDRDTESTIT